MPAMQRPAQQVDFYKYLRILWRRKWLLVIPLVLTTVLGVIFAMNHPIEYESSAVLEAAVINPRQTAGRRVNVTHEVRAMGNRMLGYQELRDIILSSKIAFDDGPVDPEDERRIEKLYRKLKRATRISPLGALHVAVAHRSSDPERNAALVNELIKRFVGEDKQQSMKEAREGLDFFQQRYEDHRKRMSEIDNQLRDFQHANPGFKEDIAILYDDHRQAAIDERDLRDQIRELEEALQGFRKQRDDEPEKLTDTIKGQADPQVLAARTHVERQREIFRQANERYTPAHRRWQSAKQELDRAMLQLRQIDKGDPDDKVVENENPRIAELDASIKVAEDKLEKHSLKLLAQAKVVAEKYDVLRRSPDLQSEKRRLEEERDRCAYLLDDYAKGLREAEKEVQVLSTDVYSSKFTVREYARVSRVPVRETKLKIVMGFAFVGLVIGVILIVLLEYLDQTFKTVDDVRETLGLPALGVIPAIYTPRDHRRRLWFRVLAFSSAAFVIGVGMLIYLAVPEVQTFLREQVWGGLQSMINSW
ncbi:MAG: hypothetical protein ISS72_06265 [Candidatus Brocadiae bacterium]|nr:hypothetical protein [Candidatus Brocadiia bacterium]